MLLYTKLAEKKAPKRRSRAGCVSCKEKKKKCDEERPQCARCVESGSPCVYEPVKPRQRRKRTDSFASSAASTTTSTTTTRTITDAASTLRHDAAGWHLSPPLGASPTARFWDLGRGGFFGGFEMVGNKRHEEWVETVDHDQYDDVLNERYQAVVLSPLEDNFDLTSPVSVADSQRHTALFHHALPIHPHILPPPPMTSGLFDPAAAGIALWDEDDEGGADDDEQDFVLVDRSRRHEHHQAFSPDLAMGAPGPVRSPLLEFNLPAFSEFSDRPNRRALVDHFCNVLSHLIVFREEAGNPFQKLVLPLSRSHPGSPVTNAIYALASAHLEHRGIEAGEEKSLFFHNRAIQGLAKLIRLGEGGCKGDVRNETLAAIILLVYYEVLVQRGRSNIVEGHLKGALTVMCSNTTPLDSTGIFLERAFRFYDVIAALSFGTAPLSTAPAAGCLLPFPPVGPLPSSLSLKNVDALLGLATTLWPVIHRLSGLLTLRKDLEKAQAAGQATKTAVLRSEFETTASAVEDALYGWTPCLPPQWELDESDPTKLRSVVSPPGPCVNGSGGDSPAESSGGSSGSSSGSGSDDSGSNGNGDETAARLHSILNNALAYRHSAFVYLYRTIRSLPRAHALVQTHARLSLRHCAATVTHQGPMGALLWPLFVAACEATANADRELARIAFSAIDHRQGMTNIERSWGIVQEVWRRADLFAAVDGDDEDGDDETEQAASSDNGDEVITDTGAASAAQGQDEELFTSGERRLSAAVSTSPLYGGAAAAQKVRRKSSARIGADLWRRVSEDMGVNIVFG